MTFNFNYGAFNEGSIACLNNETLAANPFACGTDDFLQWNIGWQDIAEQDEADSH